MSSAVSLALLRAALDPSREVARDWARRELSDPAYAQARPGWVERLARWLIDRLSELQVPGGLAPSRTLGLVLLLAIVAAVVAVALTRTGLARRGVRVRASGPVMDDVRRSAAQHRRLADQAADDGQYEDAVRERFRAVARSLEERAVLDERPGRTADEVAAEAGRSLPASAAGLRSAARLFDDVQYGGRAAAAAHDRQLRDLDDELASARPVLTASASQQ